MNVGMSNSVTTAIRDSIRETTIGKIRNTEKADRATVEQVCKCWLHDPVVPYYTIPFKLASFPLIWQLFGLKIPCCSSFPYH